MSELAEIAQSILIIESDETTRKTLIDFLKPAYNCEYSTSTQNALEKLNQKQFPVVLVNYNLPSMNSLEFLGSVHSNSPHSSVIFLSKEEVFQDAIESFRAGAFDFISKPFELKQLEYAVVKAFEQYKGKCLNNKYQNKLEELLKQKTQQLDKVLGDVESSYRATLKALIQALETRDFETHGHSERVVTFSLRLAHEIGLDKQQMRDLELGALLHDIGKIGVPDMILRKPAKLNESEWEKMKLHPIHGYKILRNIPFLENAAKVVAEHHEHWDGKGYPKQMRGENIDICARIFAVADAFDAMISDRVYRRGRPFEDAVIELEKCAGTQFDPMVVEAFKNVPKEDWETLQARSLKDKSEATSFQKVVSELVKSQHYFEMVH